MGKLFVLINQSFSGYLIVAKQMSNTLFTIFWQLKKQKVAYDVKMNDDTK